MRFNLEDGFPLLTTKKLYTKAIIYDTEPEVLRSFPVAILVGGSGNMVTSGLSDMAHEVQLDSLKCCKYTPFKLY